MALFGLWLFHFKTVPVPPGDITAVVQLSDGVGAVLKWNNDNTAFDKIYQSWSIAFLYSNQIKQLCDACSPQTPIVQSQISAYPRNWRPDYGCRCATLIASRPNNERHTHP